MKRIIENLTSWGIDKNTSATIVITIFIFAAGLLFTWLAGQIKKYKEKRSYKKSLLLILKHFGQDCDKQSKVVRESLQSAGLVTGNDFIIKFIPIGTLDYLNRLDFNIFLQNFEPFLFKKNYSSAVSKLFELIAQSKVQNESSIDFLKTFSAEYKKHERLFYENVNGLRKVHDELGVHLNGKTMEKDKGGDLIQGYFHVFGEWQKDGAKTDIISEYKEIVLKVLELNRKHQNIPLTLQTNELALQADVAYQNVEKIDNALLKKFNEFSRFHRRASKLVEVIIKILK